MVGDGKCDGPTKRKVKHLTEVNAAEEDDIVLGEATQFKDRTFLPDIKERKEVCKLVTGVSTIDEFLASPHIVSTNALLIRDILVRL